MLPSKNRLSLSIDKQDLLKGKRVAGGQFQIIGKKHQGILKIATVVSKKVAKRAVDRNRIKRIISEAIRPNLGSIGFEGTIIIIVRQNLAQFKSAEIGGILMKLISQL